MQFFGHVSNMSFKVILGYSEVLISILILLADESVDRQTSMET